MPLDPEQKSAFEQLKENIPADLVPGYSVVSSEVSPESVWLKRMKRFSDDLGLNSYAYFNYTARSKGPLKKTRRKPKKILSPEGFPADITITYAFPPPRAFYSMAKERDVKHFVFHSFGHGWHASLRGGKAVGWMNSSRSGRGVQAHELDGRTVYIPKGSDPETLAQFTRFSAGLRACLNSAAKATAHFFIDRAGNLVVIGDCNDVMFTSQGVSKTSCGVELEEAFYVLKDTKGKRNKAIWRAGGKPPGTAGNIEYFAYSPKQMLTLSILVKKLETVYPKLKERNIEFNRKSFKASSPPGYTMHDFIYPGINKKTGKLKSGHIDISPQFLTQELWDSFFNLVDTHKHINSTNVWKPRQKYEDTLNPSVVAPVSDDVVTSMSERVLNQTKTVGLAQQRTQQIANTTRKEINTQAGNASAKEALQVSQQVATVTTVVQQTQKPPMDYPTVNLSVDDSGQQVGSDDMWG